MSKKRFMIKLVNSTVASAAVFTMFLCSERTSAGEKCQKEVSKAFELSSDMDWRDRASEYKRAEIFSSEDCTRVAFLTQEHGMPKWWVYNTETWETKTFAIQDKDVLNYRSSNWWFKYVKGSGQFVDTKGNVWVYALKKDTSVSRVNLTTMTENSLATMPSQGFKKIKHATRRISRDGVPVIGYLAGVGSCKGIVPEGTPITETGRKIPYNYAGNERGNGCTILRNIETEQIEAIEGYWPTFCAAKGIFFDGGLQQPVSTYEVVDGAEVSFLDAGYDVAMFSKATAKLTILDTDISNYPNQIFNEYAGTLNACESFITCGNGRWDSGRCREYDSKTGGKTNLNRKDIPKDEFGRPGL